jgi:hypothetical protein
VGTIRVKWRYRMIKPRNTIRAWTRRQPTSEALGVLGAARRTLAAVRMMTRFVLGAIQMALGAATNRRRQAQSQRFSPSQRKLAELTLTGV